MKFLILYTFILSFTAFAGGSDGGGGPGTDLGGSSARTINQVNLHFGGSHGGIRTTIDRDINTRPYDSTILKNRFPSKITVKEDSVRGITLKSGTLIDRYDLGYTDAGKKMGIIVVNKKIHLSVGKHSTWKHVEFESGDVIQNRENRLPVMINSEGYRSPEDRFRQLPQMEMSLGR